MSVMEQKPARTRRSFTDEFKRDAVAMVLDDGNKIADVARRLGIGEGTFRPGRPGMGDRRAPRGPHLRRGPGRPCHRPDPPLLGTALGTAA
jgi:transposase-like protein